MPLTAAHSELGLLDATLPGLGRGVPFDAIHRASPRAPLSCRSCLAPMAAKVSPRGTAFFSHVRRPDACWLTGETIEHRLLKAALASSVRAAGWHAELEASGHGETPWRADVLATSPTGHRRVAFEAQLAAIDSAEIVRRSINYAAANVDVCWVTDRPRDWLGAAPYLMVSSTDAGPSVELGMYKFLPDFCADRSRCEWSLYETSAVFRSLSPGPGPLPCPGHGRWAAVPMPLDRAVALLLNGQVRPVPIDRPPPFARGRRVWHAQDGHVGFTAQHYAIMRQEQDRAEAVAELAQASQEKQWARRQERINALAARQAALRWPACEALGIRDGAAATIRRAEAAWDEYWAMGMPVVSVNDRRRVLGVVCPVASRITPAIAQRLARVVVVVASERERARIEAACRDDQEFLVISDAAAT